MFWSGYRLQLLELLQKSRRFCLRGLHLQLFYKVRLMVLLIDEKQNATESFPVLFKTIEIFPNCLAGGESGRADIFVPRRTGRERECRLSD